MLFSLCRRASLPSLYLISMLAAPVMAQERASAGPDEADPPESAPATPEATLADTVTATVRQ